MVNEEAEQEPNMYKDNDASKVLGGDKEVLYEEKKERLGFSLTTGISSRSKDIKKQKSPIDTIR